MGKDIDGFINDRPVDAVTKPNAPMCEGCCYQGEIGPLVHCGEQVKVLVAMGLPDCAKDNVVYKFID